MLGWRGERKPSLKNDNGEQPEEMGGTQHRLKSTAGGKDL